MSDANTPVQKFKLGSVTAAVWKNDKGFFSVTLQRSYKDGENWKNTDSLNPGDLLNAGKVLEQAGDYIGRQ